MKKLVVKILLILSLCFMPWDAFAAGGISVSRSSVSLTKGGSATITISVTNAAGRINISSSNGAVAAVSKSSEFVDAYQETRNYTFTISAKAAGSAVISVIPVDVATYDKEVVSGTRTITVNVTEPAPAPTPTPTPNNPKPTPSTPTPSGPADNRSTNANLSSLTVNGKALTNSNNVFTLEVSNYVMKADIAAIAADSKAKVTGTGSKDLKVGENSFNIVVTAEKGNAVTYTVKIVRKEFNTLADLNELLKLKKNVEIRISDTDKLTKAQLDQISDSNNKITLVRMSDDNKTILYSFILDGSKIKSVNEFNPNITKVVENNSDMEEALNYADGIYLDFSQCGDIPKGIILKYFVGDKYKDGDKVNLYVYGSNTVTQLKENLSVKDGYVEFEVTKKIKHFISKAKVLNAESNEFNIWPVVSLILGVIILALLIFIIVDKSKKKKTDEDISDVVEASSNVSIDGVSVVEDTPIVEEKNVEPVVEEPVLENVVKDDPTVQEDVAEIVDTIKDENEEVL